SERTKEGGGAPAAAVACRPPLSRAGAGRGHFPPRPPHRLNAGYVIGKETVAWARGSGRDAPIPDLPCLAMERGGLGKGDSLTERDRSRRGRLRRFFACNPPKRHPANLTFGRQSRNLAFHEVQFVQYLSEVLHGPGRACRSVRRSGPRSLGMPPSSTC